MSNGRFELSFRCMFVVVLAVLIYELIVGRGRDVSVLLEYLARLGESLP